MLVSLTCTWSSRMPAVTMPSPASRYEGSTWRQTTLEDSLEEPWSFSSSISSGQLLLLGLLRGLHSCQLSVPIQTKALPTRRAQYCLSFSVSACPVLLYLFLLRSLVLFLLITDDVMSSGLIVFIVIFRSLSNFLQQTEFVPNFYII